VDDYSQYTSLSGKIALVVEDNILNQLIVRKSLDYVGMRYIIVDNGDEAFDVFLANDFNIVLLDINIPGLNGYELASKIRQLEVANKKGKPILAVTGSDISDIKDKIQRVCINDCLIKPYTKEMLYDMIMKYI
jgi:two-component system, sensor histidine kinase